MIGYASKIKRIAGLGVTPLDPVRVIWRNRRLIGRLARQEIQTRYKGSFFGLAWALITPFLSLLVYTFVFTKVLPTRWAGVSDSNYSVLLFIGLIIFTIFAETITRAPGLLLENVSYLKKVVFPVEVLAVVSVLAACINALIAFAVFLVFHLLLIGLPPWQAVFVLPIMVPYALLLIGIGWLLSSMGVFLRDLRYMMPPIANLMIFLSPIFFPVSALPDPLEPYLFLNPVTLIVEQSRYAAIDGMMPNLTALSTYFLISVIVAWLGLLWFQATRRAFADVV